MKKIFLPLMLLVFLLIGCGSSHETEIVIGIDDTFAPMTFHDEKGELVGFDIELAKEAAKRMGVAVEFKPINWNNKEAEIVSGHVDMIWSGLDLIDEYKEYMIFSKPYMDNRQILFVKEGNKQRIHSEYDLKDKIVATQAGSNSETYIDSNETLKKRFAAFKTYNHIKDGFDSLDKGKYDVLIIDEIAARYETMINPGKFEIIETTIGPVTKFAIGFRKGKGGLRDKVQEAFDSMIKDGTAKQISEKWFQADLIKSHNR